jgi:integrase
MLSWLPNRIPTQKLCFNKSGTASSHRIKYRVTDFRIVSNTVHGKLWLPGERHGERVVSRSEEANYLLAAPEPLASVAAVLFETGLRPEECFRLVWDAVTWSNGRFGTLLVTHGKTAAARRVLPLTFRARYLREALAGRWETDRRLGVDSSNSQRPHGTFEP